MIICYCEWADKRDFTSGTCTLALGIKPCMHKTGVHNILHVKGLGSKRLQLNWQTNFAIGKSI